MAELRVSQLIQEGHRILESKYDVFGFVFINREEVQDILNRIDSLLPEDIKNAEIILNRYDDIIKEAQMRAERIVKEAKDTADHILSESETVRREKEEGKRIREQLVEYCEEMKGKAIQEAETIKNRTMQETNELRANADAYAEQILSSIANKLADVESDIAKMHSNIEKGQKYLEQKRMARRESQNEQLPPPPEPQPQSEQPTEEEYYEE